MDKELALRTFGYLIGHYKTHEETIINSQEIEAINYILDKNERLEQQCEKKQEINQKAIEYIKEKQKIQYKFALSQIECDELLKILEDKEVSE